MKNYILFFVLTLGILTVFQCDKIIDPPKVDVVAFSCDDSPTVCDLTANNGHFAIEAFQDINASEPLGENIFISPFSISTALSMTANGAVGETLTDMLTALKTGDLSIEEINDSYKTLLETLPALDPATKLKIANSIWPQINYPVLPDFLDLNIDKYLSETIPVDFSDPAVVDQVNTWIEDNTDGLIEDAIEELPAGVVMLLINAIYFKGDWQTEFDPENTQVADFHTIDGTTEVDMMHISESSFPYYENDLFQAVDLAYGDSIYSMSLFLPKSGHDVDEIVDALNPTSWNLWTNSFYPENIELFLPKFKMEYDIKLKPNLSNLGMEIAFTDRADFSKMIENGGVKIDDVIHKAFIEVNEAGTEAAAVTVVVIVETSVPILPTVNVDHPFFFVIRDNKTNSILFMGKMMNPS